MMIRKRFTSKQIHRKQRGRGRILGLTSLIIMLFACAATAGESTEGVPFLRESVIQHARALAEKPFEPLPQAPSQL
ncbi:MAG: hypothetical protein RBR67_20320, partial [Desulfobacterium sp.]|nr:hypothetical protein [Desulfobacterium sp.]